MNPPWEELTSEENIELNLSHDLSKYTTMRLHAKGNLIIAKSVGALRKAILFLKKNKIPYRPLGWGANSLISDKEEETFIQLQFPFDERELSRVQEIYTLPASLSVPLMTRAASQLGLMGWECLTGIPASLGGAIFMNAGTKFGEIKDILKSIDVMNDKGDIRRVEYHPGLFSYRRNHFVNEGDIIISAEVKHNGVSPKVAETIKEYMKYRKDSQPLATKNCGCVFKNFESLGAGLVIDTLGLKGLSHKNLKISEKHANFIENQGDSTLSDFDELVEMIKDTVLIYTGKNIECEVQYNYNKDND